MPAVVMAVGAVKLCASGPEFRPGGPPHELADSGNVVPIAALARAGLRAGLRAGYRQLAAMAG